MSSGAVRQLPCPDCGSPVQPDREQLCPRCGYPLMFLRQNVEDDARAVPRSPNERDDGTGLVSRTPPRTETRQFAATTYGSSARPVPGQLQCPRCGYGNDPARFRCERCGNELRQSRPHPVVLGPPVAQPQARAAGWGWLIALIILAVLAVLILAATLVWTFLL